MDSTRKILNTIAQIILVYMFLPLFFWVCSLFDTSTMVTGMLDFLGQIPLCSTVTDILSKYTNGITANEVTEITLWVFLKEIPATFITGFSIHLCISLYNLAWRPRKKKEKPLNPLPIFPGFCGIFLATVITNVIGLTKNDFITFCVEIATIILMLLGLRLIIAPGNRKMFFRLDKILLWIAEGLYAVVLSIYVAGLMMVSKNEVSSNPILFIASLATVTLIASVLVFFTRMRMDKENP